MSKLPEVYVISLDRATRRREQFQAECDRIGLTYQIFSGVDGREREAELRERTDERLWNLNMGAPLSAVARLLKAAKGNIRSAARSIDVDIARPNF